jgi:hypothetical protein
MKLVTILFILWNVCAHKMEMGIHLTLVDINEQDDNEC